jgi:hypothetical protein
MEEMGMNVYEEYRKEKYKTMEMSLLLEKWSNCNKGIHCRRDGSFFGPCSFLRFAMVVVELFFFRSLATGIEDF